VSTQLRIIDDPGSLYQVPIDEGTVRPGDMWRDPLWDESERENWSIVLPNGRVFHTTETAGGQRWDVSGESPNLTITPSIDDHNPGGAPWHGTITNGVMEP
jgi:Family of unknown function (DUF6527)